jgi:putative holliday junction resolvase
VSAVGAYLGFDHGTKRIGVALGQSLTCTARPLTTLAAMNGAPAWDEVTRLIDTWAPVALVVGLPLTQEGGEQEMTQRARRFGNRLLGRYNLPVYFEDERIEAEIRQRDHDMHHGDGDTDSIAAQVILESFLNRQAHSCNTAKT